MCAIYAASFPDVAQSSVEPVPSLARPHVDTHILKPLLALVSERERPSQTI